MNAPQPRIIAAAAADPLWYKDAIIYQMHVKSFFDSNNDGVGDFAGLMQKLDYIAELGVNTIWLLPFYPSPRRDDGYDIAEYRAVHPEYGTMNDVKRFITAAHARGLRVISELVINHTSDQHPWFQRARRAKPGSASRDFYVWSDTDQKYTGTRIIFLDTERSNWSWDPVANAYYWHRFYSHQPDLNFDNPRVIEALLGVMRFWLDLGVDGLRLDAVPYLIEREGTNNENLPETHDVLKRIRAELDKSYPDRMLLAEANQWPEDTKDYFGQGDECHMAFHFPLMPRMYMALAREDRFPITDIMRQTPQIPESCQWAIFLRNHDELTLEMVTDSERDYLWETYAADRRARINLGIRRRLSPLLERDRRRVELMNCLLLSMPGTPVIYYGDEIGMGDNIHLGDRDGVRTPMQWSPDRNGGFSRADPAGLVLPTLMDPLYGYETINVEAQLRDQHSLLHWMRRMLAIRRRHRAFGRGSLRFLYPKNRKVLAFLREYDGETILCVANVSRTPQAVELDLSELAGRVPVELSGGSLFPPIGQLTYLLTLPPYGFYWFVLAAQSEPPAWHTPAPEPMPDYVTLVTRNRIADAVASADGAALARDVLPSYLMKRRWFSAKDQSIKSVRFKYLAALPGERELLLAEIEFEERWRGQSLAASARRRVGRGASRRAAGPACARARAPRAAHRTADRCVLASGLRTPDARRVLRADADRNTGRNHHVRSRRGEQRRAVPARGRERTVAERRAVEQLADRRRRRHAEDLPQGLGRRASGSRDGALSHGARLSQHAGAARRGRAHHQEWRAALARGRAGLHPQSGRCLELDARPVQPRARWSRDARRRRRRAGRRGRRLHGDRRRDRQAARRDARGAGAAVGRSGLCAGDGRRAGGGRMDQARGGAARACLRPAEETGRMGHETVEAQAKRLLSQQDLLTRELKRLAKAGVGSAMIRIHGDFHLGQVLVASGDVYLIDFEGEPGRPLAERRAKSSPLRDVAGLMRSLDYAAAATLDPKKLTAARLPAEQREEFITSLRDRAQRAFLDAYAAASGTAAEGDLLSFFLIEKAAYELAYEAANRPSWLLIPVDGLARLAARLQRPRSEP